MSKAPRKESTTDLQKRLAKAEKRRGYRQTTRKNSALVRAGVWKLQRDAQLRRIVQRYAELADLKDLKFRPALQTLAKISLLLERSYATIKRRESLLGDDAELCQSLDVLRRLADSQFKMLEAIGLLPNKPLPQEPDMEAAFQRIESLKRANRESRNGKDDKQPSAKTA